MPKGLAELALGFFNNLYQKIAFYFTIHIPKKPSSYLKAWPLFNLRPSVKKSRKVLSQFCVGVPVRNSLAGPVLEKLLREMGFVSASFQRRKMNGTFFIC